MADREALTFKRQTVIDTLQERLAEVKREREEKVAAELAKRQEAINHITAALQNPQFVVWVMRLMGQTPDVHEDAFDRWVAETFPTPGADGRAVPNPDEAMERLIRVYEKAEDETVEVSIYDDVYRYL